MKQGNVSRETLTKVKKLAATAAKKKVRQTWNEYFNLAVEKEIRDLFEQSIIQNSSTTCEEKPLKVIYEESKPQLDSETITEMQSDTNLQEDKVANESPQEEASILSDEQMNEEGSNQEGVLNKPDDDHLRQKTMQTIDEISEREIQDRAKKGFSFLTKKPTCAIEELDQNFIKVIEAFSVTIMGHARSSTEYILEISNKFLDENAKTALQDFHNLYFGECSNLKNVSEQVNAEVDDLFDSIQDMMNNGVNTNDIIIQENTSDKVNRLSMAGLQKRLEMIISLDTGIREKLIPVLHSMQFEDFLHQRLTHVQALWKTVLQCLNDNKTTVPLQTIKSNLAKLPSSVMEREHFYRIVLKQEPPSGLKETQKNLVDILFD